MTSRMERKRRLERAGWCYYEGGWLPKDDSIGTQFVTTVALRGVDVAAILAEPPKPRGRPRKKRQHGDGGEAQGH